MRKLGEDVVGAITALKAQPGHDLQIIGSGNLIQSLRAAYRPATSRSAHLRRLSRARRNSIGGPRWRMRVSNAVRCQD